METTKTAQLISWSAYPAVIAFGLILHAFLKNLGWPLQSSTYLPIVLGAAIITFLEQKFPYRREWLPNASDVKNDSAFMLVVQVIVPKLLSFFIAIMLLKFLKAQNLTPEGYWPHHYPTYIQAIFMLLSADFLRYWLHRASHVWYPLWRLHAVHHSPRKH